MRLNNKVELYDKVKIKNKLGEDDYDYQKVKDLFINIIPANITGSTTTTTTGTTPAETTHRARCRKKSIENINTNMYFIYQNIRYDFLYFQPDFKNNDFWEIMLKVKYE